MCSLQEVIKEKKDPQKLSLDVLQTIGVARSSGGIVTQSTIDLLVAMDNDELTYKEALAEIIQKHGLTTSA